MNKYKVTTQALIGEGRKEYAIEAETEELAKEIAMQKMLDEEVNDMLLDSPGQMLTAELVGYFYGHEHSPKTIFDLIDNLEIYVAEMREKEDMETIPKYLKQYAWEYFRTVDLTKKQLNGLVIYIADKLYRILMDMPMVDNYTRAYFAKVIPFLWDTIQNRGVDLFYILDNALREDRFRGVVEFFQLTGMAVVAPYSDHGNLDYAAVEKQIRDYMGPVRMILYIEKDASVNYLDKIIQLARQSHYTTVFRTNGPDDPHITMYDEWCTADTNSHV